MDLYADEGVEKPKGNVLRSVLWEGGTEGDAFLTAAAAQVIGSAATAELYVASSPHPYTVCHQFHQGHATVQLSTKRRPLQVGQVILTLPNAFASTGLASGVFFQLIFATLALWTLFLLATLYQEFRRRKAAWRRDLHHGIIMVRKMHHGIIMA